MKEVPHSAFVLVSRGPCFSMQYATRDRYSANHNSKYCTQLSEVLSQFLVHRNSLFHYMANIVKAPSTNSFWRNKRREKHLRSILLLQVNDIWKNRKQKPSVKATSIVIHFGATKEGKTFKKYTFVTGEWHGKTQCKGHIDCDTNHKYRQLFIW